MKKLTLIIAMLLTAAVAFGQGKGLVMNEKGFHAEGSLGYIDKGAFLNVSAGYVPVRGLYVGGGVGVRRIDFARVNLRDIEYSTMVPVFLQVKYNFLNKVVSPYIDLKGGMMTDYTFSGTGWFVSPSIGISFCRRFSVFAAGEGTVNYYGRGTGKDYQKADIHPWSVGFTVSF